MNNIILVENEEILNKLKNIVPEDYIILPLLELFGTNDLCFGIFNNDSNLAKDLISANNMIKNANNIFIVFSSDDLNYKLSIAAIEFFNITFYRRIEISKFTHDVIQKSFNNAIVVEQNEINYLVTKLAIDKIYSCRLCNIFKWYYTSKENLYSDEDMKNITITRPLLYALNVIVKTEDKIDNFDPDIYKKIGVDYSYDNIQFRIKNKLKFKEEMEGELISFFNIVQDESNENIVDQFERDTKDKIPPKPLTALSLQRSCNYQFGFEPKYTMDIAKKLHIGIEINENIVSLITAPNTNSLKIDANKINDIANLIIDSFGKDYLKERNYQNKELDETKEEIVPNDFSCHDYSPKKVKEFLDEDEFKLYEYIYYRTVATQMSNLIIDATVLVVDIAGYEFKATANKILFEGWHKLGKHWMDHDVIKKEIVELPQKLYAGQRLKKLEATIYEVPERTPFRYGIGRFIEKATSIDILKIYYL